MKPTLSSDKDVEVRSLHVFLYLFYDCLYDENACAKCLNS